MIFHRLLVPRQLKISWAKKKIENSKLSTARIFTWSFHSMKCPLIIIELNKNVGLLFFFSSQRPQTTLKSLVPQGQTDFVVHHKIHR